MNYSEAEKLVKGFEEGTYPAAQWTHESHFVIALWYTYHQPIHKARHLIKTGIQKYNIMVSGKNTDDSGYHETITEFYIQTIVQFQLSLVNELAFDELLIRFKQQRFMTRNFPFEFYNKETLMSKKARREWVKPDLKKLHIAIDEI